ncbi:Atg27p SCDLUD_003950 [Saccharomycodes ludwigii]|uniref:Atg27p n=1 Tax=Saccharomycodes ludwigii TaxID=36035 RepID=UPI001E898C5F|nr:hypothetical protein SCDLUD_003950 [Saccharomycodes ludwigii]KAH3899667.1 hypothetical protein SCDLUD_003950 [Saccharomycodes ludwigii]
MISSKPFFLSLFFLLLTLFSSTSLALDCSKHDILKNYRISNTKDVSPIFESIEKDTPPSKTKQQWWINVCNNKDSDHKNLPDKCSSDTMLCGVEYVTIDDQTLLIELIDFGMKTETSVSVSESNELTIENKGYKWGSQVLNSNIVFQCDTSKENDEVQEFAWGSDDYLEFTVKGPSGCLLKKNDGDNDSDGGNGNDGGNDNDDDNDNNTVKKSNGHSWFFWIIMYAFLFTLIYLCATSYVATRGGSLADFREEFVERGTTLIKLFPQFCKELIYRVLHGSNNSNSHRGGYSAV